MEITYGKGTTGFGPGVAIDLTGDEVATAIYAYLVAHNVHISGARTVTVNGAPCDSGHIYVDPSASVIAFGRRFSGSGPASEGN